MTLSMYNSGFKSDMKRLPHWWSFWQYHILDLDLYSLKLETPRRLSLQIDYMDRCKRHNNAWSFGCIQNGCTRPKKPLILFFQ